MSMRQKVVWLALLACCALLAARLYFRHRPECFPEEVSSYVGEIQDGWQYWLVGNAILAQPVTGGPVREVVREDSQAQISAIHITNGAIFYAYSIIQPNNTGGIILGAPVGSHFLGIYRTALHKPSAREKAQEKRVVLHWPQALLEDPWHVHSVPIRGGTPRDLTSQFGGYALFVGSDAYWIKKRLDDTVQIRYGGATWEEETGHSALMVTSLVDGATRALIAGLPMDTILISGQNGVFWTEPRPFPDSSHDLFYYRTGEAKLYKIPDYRGDAIDPPAEYEGRLYWFATDKPAYRRDWSADRLMSANLDGSGLRTVFETATNKRVPVVWHNRSSFLRVYRGSLYGLFRDQNAGLGRILGGPRFLCRLRPDQGEPVEDLFTLPPRSGNCTLDGDYFYYNHLEDRPFMDLLTGGDSHTQRGQMLCRIRLPD